MYGLQLGCDFSELKRRNKAVKEWLKQVKYFSPHVACFSERQCALATTFARWRGWRLLEDWEKKIRSAAINPAVRNEAARAQEVLEAVVMENPEASPQKLVSLGIDALQQLDFFRDCGDFGPWWAMACLTLEHKDQCPSCRCMFRHSRKLQENSPVKHPLGKNREKGRACQCAEVALYSIVVDTMLQDFLDRQRAAWQRGLRFGYNAPKQEEQARQRRWSF